MEREYIAVVDDRNGATSFVSTEPIVHCRDCKYSEVYTLDSNVEPLRWCKVGLAKVVDDDDYCSWGETYTWGDVYPIGAIFYGRLLPQGIKPDELFEGVWKEIEPNVFERVE